MLSDAAEALGLVIRLDSLQDGVKKIKVSAANVVTLKQNAPVGLSDFAELTPVPGKYTIKIDPDTKGVVHPVRWQPAALTEKVREWLRW